MNPVHLFFHWPDGGVWSNIVANILWSAPLWILMFWRMEKHHRERVKQNSLHNLQTQKKLDKLTRESKK